MERRYSIETYNELMKDFKLPFTDEDPVVDIVPSAKAIYDRFDEEKIKNMISEKINDEIKEALLSESSSLTSSKEKQFTTEELIKHAQELKKKIEEAQNNLDYNFNGELMNIETITTIIKFIKAHKPRFEFQLALKATGELKQVRRILGVDIIDLGDYGKDGQIYILPKEPPKYFTVKFE